MRSQNRKHTIMNFSEHHIKRAKPTSGQPACVFAAILTFRYGALKHFLSDKMKEQLRVFLNWVVYPDGTIEHISPDYIIAPDLLRSGTDWIDHMSQKNWVDIQSFSSAYEYALSITRGNNG